MRDEVRPGTTAGYKESGQNKPPRATSRYGDDQRDTTSVKGLGKTKSVAPGLFGNDAQLMHRIPRRLAVHHWTFSYHQRGMRRENKLKEERTRWVTLIDGGDTSRGGPKSNSKLHHSSIVVITPQYAFKCSAQNPRLAFRCGKLSSWPVAVVGGRDQDRDRPTRRSLAGPSLFVLSHTAQ